MKNSKYVRKTAPRARRKGFAVVVAVILLLTVVVGSTIAYLMAKSDPVRNVFEPTDVTCYVAETFDGITKSNVRIQNTGNIDAYIRVAIVVNYVNANGNVCGGHGEVAVPTPQSPWVDGGDGYYYWPNLVAPAGYTGNLFDSLTLTTADDGCNMQVEFVASAIQAAGDAKDEVW